MAEERFEITIILDAISKVAPAMNAVADAGDKMAARLKVADKTVQDLDKHLGQLDGHATKARDTLRSMNPTLDALDGKMKNLSGSTGDVNKNMDKLSSSSAKAAAGLGSLDKIIDGLQKKLSELDAKLTEVGARDVKPEVDIDTDKAASRVNALILKLENLERKKTKVRIDSSISALQGQIDEVEAELTALGAHDHVVKLRLELNDEASAKLDELARKQTIQAEARQTATEAARSRAIAGMVQDFETEQKLQQEAQAQYIKDETEKEAARHASAQREADRVSAQRALDAKASADRLAQIAAERAETEKLFADVARQARAADSAKTDVERTQALGKLDTSRTRLGQLGQGDRADNLILQVGIDGDKEAEARIKALDEAAAAAARKRDIQFQVQGEQVVRASLREIRAEVDELASKNVGVRAFLDTGEFKEQYGLLLAQILSLTSLKVNPKVSLSLAEFEAQYLLVEGELLALGLKREHVKVIVDYDRSKLDELADVFDRIAKKGEDGFSGISTKLRDAAFGALFTFAQAAISSLDAVAGSLLAVGSAAGVAAAGIAGLATAGVAQAIPVLGILAAALARVALVLKASTLESQAKDKASTQGAKADNAAANAAEAVANAQQGVADALRGLTRAQEALNKARQQGIRDLQDLIAAEQRANLQAADSQLALGTAIGGQGGTSVYAAQLQARQDATAASRQTTDTRTAVAGGVEGLPSVVAANQAVGDAQRTLDRARQSVADAERQQAVASKSDGAAADNLATALGKLSGAEKDLLKSVDNFKKLFAKGGPLGNITDPLVESFSKGLDQIIILLKDPELDRAAKALSGSMGKGFEDFVKFLTSGPIKAAFIDFTKNASKSIGPVEKLLEDFVKIFVDIAKAAQGPFATALNGAVGFFDRLAGSTDKLEKNGKLEKFFTDALQPIEAFLKLGGAIIELFAALAGVGGGADEGTKGIERLTVSINKATDYVKKNGDKVRQFFKDSIDATSSILSLFFKVGAALVKSFDPDSVKQLSTFLGDTVVPALQDLIKFVGIATKEFLKLVNTPVGHFFAQNAILLAGAAFLASKLSGVLKPIAGLIRGVSSGFEKLAGNKLLKAGVGGAAEEAGGAAAAGGVAGEAGGVAGAAGLGAALPVAGVAALGIGVVLLLQHFGDLGKIWKQVTTSFDSLKTQILPNFDSFVKAISRLEPLARGLSHVLGDILVADIKILAKYFGTTLSIALNLATDAINLVVDAFSPSRWSKLPGDFLKLGKDIVNGLIAPFKLIWDDIKIIFDALIESFKDFFGIHSPSTVFLGLGKSLVDGIVHAFEALPDAMLKVIKSIPGLIGGELDKVGDFIKDKIPFGIGKKIFGGGGKPAADSQQPGAAPGTPRSASSGPQITANTKPDTGTTGGLPSTSIPVGLNPAAQAKFMRDWEAFWDRLVKTAQKGGLDIGDAFRQLRIHATDSTSQMYLDVRSNLADIENSFEARGQNIQDTWSTAVLNVQQILFDGLDYIGHQTNLALSTLGSKKLDFGLSAPQHDSNVKTKATGGWLTAATGWIGAQGERGKDAVHAVLGRGEAVLNYAQQKIVEPALQNTYGSGYGLSAMFGSSKSMHAGMGGSMLATGGFAAAPGTNFSVGEEPKIASDLRRLGQTLHTIVTGISGYRTPQHSVDVGGFADDPHTRGQAADISVPGGFLTSRTADAILRTIGLYRPFYPAQLKEINHVQLLGDGVGKVIAGAASSATAAGAASPVIQEISRVTTNVTGSLGKVVQKAFDKVRDSANEQQSSASNVGAPAGGGAAGTAQVRAWATTALKITHLLNPANLSALIGRIMFESSGNPKAINLTDSNAAAGHPSKGLGQTIDSTFEKYRLKSLPDNIYDPIANLVASVRYMIATYGHIMGDTGVGYAGGGFAWGGAQAKGGTYEVNKPTLFLAGEAGKEVAHFAPGGIAGNTRPKIVKPTGVDNQYAQNAHSSDLSLTQLTTILAQINALAAGDSFTALAGAVRGVIASLKKLSTKTAAGLHKLTRALDLATTDGSSPVDLLVTQVEGKLTNATNTGRNVGTGVSNADGTTGQLKAAGVTAGSALTTEAAGLGAANQANNRIEQTARRALAAAQKSGSVSDVQRAQGALNKAITEGQKIAGLIASNAAAVFNSIVAVYDRATAAIGRQQKLDSAAGRTGSTDLIDQQQAVYGKELTDLQKQLSAANKSGNKTLAGQIADKIADIQESIQELVIQKVQDQLDAVNAAADERNANIGRKFKAGDILGIPGNATAEIDANRASAQQQVGDLGGVLQQAIATNTNGNNDALIQKIQDQIADLNNQIIQYASDRVQSVIDAVNTDAQNKLNTNDVQNQLAQIGIATGDVVNGFNPNSVSTASLGRPNYSAIGQTLQDKGSILSQQRAGLVDALGQAQSVGNQKQIADLINQIGGLDVSIAQNSQAIRDNTDASVDAAIAKQQGDNSFLLSLNQGAQAINGALEGLSGISDKATELALLQQQGSEQSKANNDNKGSLAGILNTAGVDTSGLAGASGNALVPYLQQLYTQGVATGNLDDDQLAQIQNLITAIISGTQATIDNTTAIKNLNGAVAQTFTSSAFSTFRQSIFDGNAGLLPNYTIPSMDTGGYVGKGGLFNLHAGEKVLTKKQVDSGSGNAPYIGEQHNHITNPTEVLDEMTVGRKIAWAMAGTGRS